MTWLLPPAGGKNVRLVGAVGITAAKGLAGFDVESAAIVTLNDWVAGALVPSLAVTVTVNVPVTPVGALSSNTPVWCP